MDFGAFALSLLGMGADLIAKGKEMWAAQGLDPDDYDATVAAALAERNRVVGEQETAEKKVLG